MVFMREMGRFGRSLSIPNVDRPIPGELMEKCKTKPMS
jgi:hypothetical protein